jgi:hypothetical protein
MDQDHRKVKWEKHTPKKRLKELGGGDRIEYRGMN